MTKKELKFQIAQHYGISEADVDDSLLPFFMSLIKTENSIAKKIEDNKKVIETTLTKHSQTNEQLTEKIKGSITTTTHNYLGASWRTAFMVRWGWGIWVLVLIMLAPLFWLVYNEYLAKGAKYKALENIIQYDKKADLFYIDAKNYHVQNDKYFKGVILHTEK